jgi:hypothetical protein
MAITDSQKVDYLYKKLGYGVAKTDTSAVKSPSNEGNASPLLIRGDTLWVSSGNVPASAPSSNTRIVAVYTGTAAVRTINDGTSSTNRTWLTNLSDWIGSEFGATYQPRVWAAPSATANASATGTRLFPDGSGNNDSWFFDPQSGILNFADTNVPTSVAGNVVFIEGYRYIGPKGVANATGNIIFSNVTITNNFANANIYLTPTGTGQVVVNSNLTANAGIQNTVIGNTGATAGYFTTINSTGNVTLNGLTVNTSATFNSNLTVLGNLYVQGNTITTGSNNVSFTDSIIELHTLPNLGNLTFNDGKDIGIRFHYYFTQNQDAALVLANDTGFLEWYGAFAAETAGTTIGANATYGTIKSGDLVLANSTISTSSSTGALRVSGGAGITGNLFVGNILTTAGGLQATPIGNLTPSTALFTTVSASGNITGASLTSNGSATVGSTLGVVGNITASNLNLTSNTISFANSSIVQVNPLALAITGAYQIAIKPAGGIYQWTFNNDGSLTGPQYITAYGGIQNTTIGNVTPSTAIFTSESVSGNSTVNALTVNNSATIAGTLGVTGNVVIAGNLTVANITYLNQEIVSNTEVVSANLTANALTINTSATIGTTLGVNGNSFVVSGNQVSINSSTFISNAALQINTTDSILLPKGTDFQRPSPANVGMFRFSISSNKVEWYTGSIWQAPVTEFTLTTSNSQSGTGSQTVFTLPVSNATTAGTIVSVNGIVQRPVDAYSITGANLTFTEAPSVTDVVDFRIFTTTSSVTSIADVYGNTGVFVDQITGDRVIRLKTSGTDSLKVEANTRVTVTGNINIVGSLTASSKSFLIDHPSKPGYKLQYGSLEGPEHGVYVRGRQQGSNVILLPDYWVDLVDPTSITVQVTAIGQAQTLYVEDIKDNKVYLAATLDPYNMNFFYFVQAERKDIDKLLVEFN